MAHSAADLELALRVLARRVEHFASMLRVISRSEYLGSIGKLARRENILESNLRVIHERLRSLQIK